MFRKGSASPAPHVAPVAIQLRTKIIYYYQTNHVACVKHKCYIYQQGQNDGHRKESSRLNYANHLPLVSVCIGSLYMEQIPAGLGRSLADRGSLNLDAFEA